MIYNLGNRIVNNYLISIDKGYILIDTGYENGFHAFQRRLAKHGVKPEEIRYIFLTHAHDDHAGFLNDVLRITDAPVVLHSKAIDGLQKGQNSFKGGCSSLLAYLFCRLMGLFGKGEHKYPPIKGEYMKRLITIDSNEFKELHFPCEIIETPGHTADHISLLKDGILFCGDAAMNNFPSIRRTIIWIEDLKSFKESWKKIIALDPAKIYPAHGKPFSTADLVRYLPYLDKIKLRPLRKEQD
ncbi:MAG: MBL fold metallo-hydrolase [Bulleidia sp.]|nr:MBL fold metallo-hydrolase [Bulleidia sp.]